jgi:hypothetical protein
MKIDRYFRQGEEYQDRIACLAGLQGYALSQLAAEYCVRRRSYFGAIFWINASSPQSMMSDLVAIADQLGVHSNNSESSRISTVLAIFASWPCRWLVVLDQYSGWKEGGSMKLPFPISGQGSLIINETHPTTDVLSLSPKVVYPPKYIINDCNNFLMGGWESEAAVNYWKDRNSVGYLLSDQLEPSGEEVLFYEVRR